MMHNNMKRKLITLILAGTLSLGSFAFAQDQNEEGAGRHGGRKHNSIERITESLNLTPEQKTKVQPILDQARPQIEDIRREALQKTKAVMDNVKAQIRPMLTPEQQQKLDEVRNDRHADRAERKGNGELQNQ